MESYLISDHFDLITPDGMISSIKPLADGKFEAIVTIDNISPAFMGFKIDPSLLIFNIKSTLAQLGINGIGKEIRTIPKERKALVKVELYAIGKLGQTLLELLTPGAYIGKIFAADDRRRVRDPIYLTRMFGRSDRDGFPLLSLGGMQGSNLLTLKKENNRAVAYLSLQEGIINYEADIFGFLPTLARALHVFNYPVRNFLQLNQRWVPGAERKVKKNEILLVRTLPLHIRTVFAKVVDELLPKGVQHTSASVLQPDTKASGDVYELFGSADSELGFIPLEFYTLEPHREHVFFSDRDQLQTSLEDEKALFKTFESSPLPVHYRAAVFVVKGEQLLHLTPNDWILRETHPHQFPGLADLPKQSLLVERYIRQQPDYPFLKAIEDGLITSQGVMFTRYFPSPLMKKMYLSDQVQRCLKGIYFKYPSLSYGDYFSHEDRSFLLDLAKFAIPVYWIDEGSGKVLKYVPKPGKDSGMFVPLPYVEPFVQATTFGIYGSTLTEGIFEDQLAKLMQGLLDMREYVDHPLMHKDTPIALVTGGGPGIMEVGNRVAQNLNLISCANIVDFRGNKEPLLAEQKQNPYIEAKMTYRIDRLVERQAEFNLDFPIFLIGGIGTDFEYALEEVRRKVSSSTPCPILLFGPPEYWKRKITSRFQCNLESGTIAGSEWISSCFFCVQTAAQGLKVYQQFFNGTLPIGQSCPISRDGFVIVTD